MAWKWKRNRIMKKIDSIWLCALLIASGKIPARDVTPADLEDLDSFVAGRSRRELIDLEDALEFAERAMAQVSSVESVELVKAIGAMRRKVGEVIYESRDVKRSVEILVRS